MNDKGRSDRCFMDSYDCPAVWTLRRFRDIVLKKSCLGRLLVRVYYAISPEIVARYGGVKRFTGFCHRRLDRLVALLQEKGFKNTTYVDGVQAREG